VVEKVSIALQTSKVERVMALVRLTYYIQMDRGGWGMANEKETGGLIKVFKLGGKSILG